MKNKRDYLEWLKIKIERLHNCGATYHETVPVHQVFRGKAFWPSEVEVFDLIGHPLAKRAYAWGPPVPYEWGHLAESDDLFTAPNIVMELPPVDSAQKAVQAHLEKTEKEVREACKAAKKEMKEQFSKPYPSTN